MEPYFKTQKNVHLKLLSSDKVNLELAENYMRKHPNSNKTEAFQKTRYLYRDAYDEEIENIFSEIYEEALEAESNERLTYFIYIDKNHPLNYPSQKPVHEKIRKISKFDSLKFISLTILAKEIVPKTEEICEFKEIGPK